MSDPLLARRARIARAAELGQRIGYLMFGLSIVAFVWGAVASFPSASIAIVIATFIAGTVTLAPAIVAGYAVKAAEREDLEMAAREREARRRS
jgi:hypothetical protein